MALPIPHDLAYVILLFLLFVVPKALQRYRVPSAITSLLLGVLASVFGLFEGDQTIKLLASFGIVSLFLFAGLEVEWSELQPGAKIVAQHLLIRVLTLAGTAYLIAIAFHLQTRAAALVALALLTPSTGFILHSLGGFGLSADEIFWVKAKAIAAELLALCVMFLTLQTTSWTQLGISSLTLATLVFVVPVLFRLFAARIAPFAPRSEFAFLLMLAMVCAYTTKKLGVYYLVGAFLVGVAASRFREKLPAMSSDRMLHAIEAFASFFAAFYFFEAGLHIHVRNFSLGGLLTGAGFLIILVPFRIGLVRFHRRAALGESRPISVRVAVSLLPTLVFTLVLAEILREQFSAADYIFDGLIIYTVVNTTIPAFILRSAPPEYDAPQFSEEHRVEGGFEESVKRRENSE